MQMHQTYEGIISLYNIGKWGFIDPFEEDSTDVFFHVSNCAPGYSPQVGDRVRFELAPPYKLGRRHQALNMRAAHVEVFVQSVKNAGGTEVSS